MSPKKPSTEEHPLGAYASLQTQIDNVKKSTDKLSDGLMEFKLEMVTQLGALKLDIQTSINEMKTEICKGCPVAGMRKEIAKTHTRIAILEDNEKDRKRISIVVMTALSMALVACTAFCLKLLFKDVL